MLMLAAAEAWIMSQQTSRAHASIALVAIGLIGTNALVDLEPLGVKSRGEFPGSKVILREIITRLAV
jgi:hypothetical protein